MPTDSVSRAAPGVATDQVPRDPRSRRRTEDRRFLTGTACYADDAPPPGALVALFVRSPHAHAALGPIAADTARAAPGVCGVFTGEDLAVLGCLPCATALRDGSPLIVPPRPVLARGRVRFVGDPVALIVARTRAAALDAQDLLEIGYAALPEVTDLARAADEGATELWPEAPGNVAYRFAFGDPAAAERAIAAAAHVVGLRLENNRILAAAMEPRTATGEWDAAHDRYRLTYSGAAVHLVRDDLARHVFRIPPERIEVINPDTGGGFGMKSLLYPEYAALLWAARRLGAAIHWVADRSEEFLDGTHARANLTHARLGLDREGRFLGLVADTLGDLGAYVSSGGPGSATNAPATAMGGLYAIPAIGMRVRGIFTNTAPIDAYRGAGKPEANYIIERLIDLAAHRHGFDRVELRRRNLPARYPYTTAMGFTVDVGDPGDNIARALAAADADGFAARRARSQAAGRLRGLGLTCFLETARGAPDEGGWALLLPDGRIELRVGSQSNGQGHETSFLQLVAAHVGLDPADFTYVQADTRLVPRGGAYGGARSLHLGGTALLLAADDLVRSATPLAARLLQARPDEVRYAEGAFLCRTGRLSLPELGRALAQAGEPLPRGVGDNRCDRITFPHGCHVAEVEIDPDTGAVTLDRYGAVDDYGRLVNPLLAQGQVQGGVAQGIGQALMEVVRYDADGGQLLTGSFMDYAVPRGADLPMLPVGMVERPTDANPMGAKGAGQAGAIAAPQAVVNAVMDALAPFGIEHLDMPLTSERVWRALRDARRSA